MMCRACHRNKCNRPAGLCWRCYYTPGIRRLFPSQSKFARKQKKEEDTTWPAKLPPEPTTALPGSIEKMLVLADRAAKRFLLHHPEDATLNVA